MLLPNEKYTIGWICAIIEELVAAREFLDERHEGPEYQSPDDNNNYTLGTIGKHNVVIAVLPAGEYGTTSAASVASDLMRSFSNVRFGLMVGIGGGAPSKKNDIRLGDIVVSEPRDGTGGVLQYDFGKTIQGQSFRTTGFLNQPPRALRAALNGLKATYESDGHRFEDDISMILEKKRKLRNKYKRPNPSMDRLYKSGVIHGAMQVNLNLVSGRSKEDVSPRNNYGLDDANSCTNACGCEPSDIVSRPTRTDDDDDPAIHYGLIASANQLMKDAVVRDKLSADNGVLCFEMEAAGLMNTFPCLVIRGICDYSDSHKNKDWQGYAAMVAAAYAKDLLRAIAPSHVEAEKKISDVLSNLQEVAKDHRDIAKEQLDIQQNAVKQSMSETQRRCLHLFRLTTSTEDATYEWYKDRVETRVHGTCEWFLRHDHFQEWQKQESGPLLVSADPGCGKSVLAKYLIDHVLPGSATICYFFFKDQDQNTVRQALCALLHQLMSQQPFLIQHALKRFDKDGAGLINSTNALWTILEHAVQDPQARPIIVVLDALDECAESEFEGLMKNLESQFRGNRSGRGKLKCLLTSRPYEQVISKFRNLLDAFPRIRIPGEEESDRISQEVNHVIVHRVEQLAKEKMLSRVVKDHLEERLLSITHRTYLWIYLVFDYLRREHFKKTTLGVEAMITTLPKSINEAYEQILNRSKNHVTVRKALCIILAAERPLTLAEMNIAINIENTSQSIHDLDLEEEADFKARLRTWCGLFVSIHHGKIYFLHQTAREFLLTGLSSPASGLAETQWHQSISLHFAHSILAELCVRYLVFFNSPNSTTKTTTFHSLDIDNKPFLDYSARSWGFHVREIDHTGIAALVSQICDPDSKSFSVWFLIYENYNPVYRKVSRFPTGLMVAAYFGHASVVALLLSQGADMESKDDDGRTSLSWAAECGYDAVVELLLRRGASIKSIDEHGQRSLPRAAERGFARIVQLLLANGADPESLGRDERTALVWAAGNGSHAIVALLLEEGADAESRDGYHGRTALSWAAGHGHIATVELLLDRNADIESEDDDFGWTPLFWAVEQGHLAVVKLLIDKGANMEAVDRPGMTPLLWAMDFGHRAVAELLQEEQRATC